MLKLAGRTAVVTGAAGGIGRGIALALARRGCDLALADIDETALSRTAGRASRFRPRSMRGCSVVRSIGVVANDIRPPSHFVCDGLRRKRSGLRLDPSSAVS